MRISIKKDLKVADKIKLFKHAEGKVIAHVWGEDIPDQYLAEFPEGKFLIEKSSAEIVERKQ